MDLATKSKNISFPVKALCLLLSVVLMAGAANFAYILVDTLQYYDITLEDFESGSLKDKQLADTQYLAVNFLEDIFTLQRSITDKEPDSRYDMHGDLVYLIADTKTQKEVSNLPSGETKESVLTHPYAFTVVNGKCTYSKALEGLFDRYDPMHDFWEDTDGNTFDVYCYVDETWCETNTGARTFTAYINGALAARKVNPKTTIIGLAVCFLLALALAVYAFVVAGRRKEDGKVKLMWLDYIPTDVHLLASGAAIVGLFAGIDVLLDDALLYLTDPMEMRWFRWGIVAIIALMWTLFLEFMTSFVRACKSEKRLYKNTLVYLVLHYVIFKPLKALGKRVKALFAYKPQHFRRVILGALIFYLAVNVLFFLCLGILLAADADFIVGMIPITLLILFNIVTVFFAADYLKKLDLIIIAARNRTVPQVDYNKLPPSLKTLADSLQYTRQELNAAVSRAVRDERMRTELITNVSHDLKTPLTSIISYVDLLKGCDIQDENAKEYIAVLDEKGNRLKRLIEDLIEASKITSGVISLNPVELSLSELAAQAVYERHQEFVDNDLELVFKGDHGNVNAYCDGNKTFRVLENLISNAKKYSAKGSRVYCDVYETQNFSIFEIKNISAQPLDITPQELTERFVRGDKARTNEGNGLGLSIADNLCKAQNGHLYITIDGDLFKAQVMLPKHA